MSTPALEVIDLNAWYDQSHVVRGVGLQVPQGQVAALLGRYGAGCSSILRALMGLIKQRSGSVRIHGTESIHLPMEFVGPLGIGYCRGQKNLLADLSCEENLLLPATTENTLGGSMSLAEIYEVFPRLHEHRYLSCSQLSGGEQKMLAIARLLRTGVNIILLDDLSDGVAPAIFHDLQRMVRQLKAKRYAILLVDENPQFAHALADQFYLIDSGQVIDQFPSEELAAKQEALNALSN